MSSATVTPGNMDIGPCKVTFDGVDLGGTLGNVTVSFKVAKAAMKADQFGDTVLDESVSGIECTVETEIAEVRDKDKLAKVFPNATLITSGAQKALQFNSAIGSRSLALAKELVLHPLVEATTSEDFDWTFYKAIPTEESSYVFSPTEQGKMKIQWRILLDTSVVPARMFRHGDKDVA